MITRDRQDDLPAGVYVLLASVKGEGLQADGAATIFVAVAARPLTADDCSNAASGWFEGVRGDVTTRYQAGRYHMTHRPDILSFYWQLPWRDAGNVALEMDAAAVSTELTEYGRAVAANASGRQALLLRVANSGMFKVTQRSGDVLAHLTDWIVASGLSRVRSGTTWRRCGGARRGADGVRQRPTPAGGVGVSASARSGARSGPGRLTRWWRRRRLMIYQVRGLWAP